MMNATVIADVTVNYAVFHGVALQSVAAAIRHRHLLAAASVGA